MLTATSAKIEQRQIWKNPDRVNSYYYIRVGKDWNSEFIVSNAWADTEGGWIIALCCDQSTYRIPADIFRRAGLVLVAENMSADLEPNTKCVKCEEPMHESELSERGLCEACDR